MAGNYGKFIDRSPIICPVSIYTGLIKLLLILYVCDKFKRQVNYPETLLKTSLHASKNFRSMIKLMPSNMTLKYGWMKASCHQESYHQYKMHNLEGQTLKYFSNPSTGG